MKVFIGAPVRNRGWVLKRHLDAILNQKDIEMEFCYVLNDSEDDTEDILKSYKIPYVVHNLGKQYGHLRGQYSTSNLAILRNVLVDEFLKSDADFLFSCDTDVIIPENSLKHLIDNDKDICAMLIRNHPKIYAHNAMIGGKHIPKFTEGIHKVDLTGAVYLIKRKVLEAGVRYGEHRMGEDGYFSEQAKKMGFEMFVDTRLRPIHAYDKGVDLIAQVY